MGRRLLPPVGRRRPRRQGLPRQSIRGARAKANAAREGVVAVGRPAANNGTELSADVLDTVPGDEWSSIAVADWAQCGGLNSLCQEDKACLSCESAGWTCQRGNEWWWQCRKAVAGPDAPDSGETKPGQKPAAVGDWERDPRRNRRDDASFGLWRRPNQTIQI